MSNRKKNKFGYIMVVQVPLIMMLVLFQNCARQFETLNPFGSSNLGSNAPNAGGGVGPELATKCEAASRQKIHKLTKIEYAATVRDLFALSNPPVSFIPEDEPGLSGFANDSTYWKFSTQNVQAYVDNAQLIMGEVMKTPAKLYACSKDDACARITIQTWMERIYRRPVIAGDVELIYQVYAANKADGFDAALGLSFQAMLASSSFLTRTYQDAGYGAGQTYVLGPYELASNLSYFVWGSLPDPTLFAAAKNGSLLDNSVLEAQVRRMLRDPRSEALTKNFARYWLNLQRMSNVKPSTALFPEWNDSIRNAMEAEAEMFFRHVVAEDLNIETLLTANYTFLNEQLANFYGIPGVTGTALRKVTVPMDAQKAGILTLGSMLTMNSAADHTRPIGRGLWILSKVMCSEPPSPPPNIPQLEGDQFLGESAIRERLAAHRNNGASCAGCHASMDPIGLGLEIFNPIGKVRRTYRDGVAIDPAGELPVGKRFTTVHQMRDLIVAENNFKSCFSRQLSAYAVGRPMNSVADKCNARNIAIEGAVTGKKFSDLVLSLVKSPIFKTRTGASQ